jgi:hypothetical protein
MALKLIYHFQTSQNHENEFIPASYGVVYFFSDEGYLDKDFLLQLAKSIHPDANSELLTFPNLDDLKAFAMRICQELSERDVRLISVQDYNIGIDSAKDLVTFQGIFNKYGEIIQNESARKKGIMAKFFKG